MRKNLKIANGPIKWYNSNITSDKLHHMVTIITIHKQTKILANSQK